MITPADDAIVSKAAWYVGRQGSHASLTFDDLKQQARLVLLRSDIPVEPLHRGRYVFQRAAGAMRDAIRSAYGDMPNGMVELLDDDRTAECGAERRMQWIEGIQRFERKATRQCRQAIELLADGMTPGEVAEKMQITPSRVSMLRLDARRLIEVCV